MELTDIKKELMDLKTSFNKIADPLVARSELASSRLSSDSEEELESSIERVVKKPKRKQKSSKQSKAENAKTLRTSQ